MEIVFIFIIGAIFGSFANVLIFRIPQNMSIILPFSFCPRCKKSLGFMDKIPMVSYLILGGKCRYCGEKIPKWYLLGEVLGGIFGVFSFYCFGNLGIVGFFYFYFLCFKCDRLAIFRNTRLSKFFKSRISGLFWWIFRGVFFYWESFDWILLECTFVYGYSKFFTIICGKFAAKRGDGRRRYYCFWNTWGEFGCCFWGIVYCNWELLCTCMDFVE